MLYLKLEYAEDTAPIAAAQAQVAAHALATQQAQTALDKALQDQANAPSPRELTAETAAQVAEAQQKQVAAEAAHQAYLEAQGRT